MRDLWGWDSDAFDRWLTTDPLNQPDAQCDADSNDEPGHASSAVVIT